MKIKLMRQVAAFVGAVVLINSHGFAVCNGGACAGDEAREGKPLAVIPAPRLISHSWMSLAKWYRMHADDVEEADAGAAKIVLVGDSITEGWQWGEGRQWQEFFVPEGTTNQGIGGDMTQNVLWRLAHGDVQNLKPERVICLIGTNNFGHTDETPDQVAQGVIAVYEKLTEVFPEAEILAFAVFPRGQSPQDPDREKIRQLNEKFQHVGEWKHLTFMDIGSRFLSEDGSISAEIMPDFLHLSPKGYDIWLEAIKEWIATTPVKGSGVSVEQGDHAAAE